MLLRPRQKLFVERSVAALRSHGNTIGVAPTGAGKTIMLSGVVGEILKGSDAKACVLAHRDELTAQNRAKFARVNPGLSTSVVDAGEKSWQGRATFAMAPTLARESNLDQLPALDLLVIDEAHHAAADSYRRIIDRVQTRNPKALIYGVTATPNRGDRKGLRPVFSNVADQIRIGELIASGHLVPPRTFVIDVGVQSDLGRVRKTADDFDMAEVAKVMNRTPVTAAVAHATAVANAFREADVPTVLVTGEMAEASRKAALADFAEARARVIVNVAVLTEGWDHPPTSCVLLLRPSSWRSTMVQMVGRGLRTVNPQEHSGVLKTDCIVLDFGTSTILHGSLEQDVDLDGREPTGEAPTKTCPSCDAIILLSSRECPLCGHAFTCDDASDAPQPLGDFVMSEIDLLKRSSFKWCDLFGDDAALVATGFTAWAGVFFLNGRWYAVGGRQGQSPTLVGAGERMVCLASADDWLNEHESDETAHKTRRWLSQPATDKQLALLPMEYRQDFGLTRYQASALIAFQFNKSAIRRLVFGADRETLARAA
jgi:superfamily II DNA or RNA helicase